MLSNTDKKEGSIRIQTTVNETLSRGSEPLCIERPDQLPNYLGTIKTTRKLYPLAYPDLVLTDLKHDPFYIGDLSKAQ